MKERIKSDSMCTFRVQDNDAVQCGPSYTSPAKSDGTAQTLHNSQVGHPPYWLLL